MSIEESNKLISEFMEIELFGEEKDHTEALLICSALDLPVSPCTHFENVLDTVYLDDMRFDKSWDWLMPVVEKIKHELYYNEDSPIFQEDFEEVSVCLSLIEQTILECELDDLYKLVVEFIQWYNKEKE